MTEEWKRSISEPNYFVSNEGYVYSNRARPCVMKPHKINTGYLAIGIQQYRDEFKTYLIHRLVAEVFCPNPYDKPNVNHKDGNRLNNRADNLEWVTQQENVQHAIEMGFR